MPAFGDFSAGFGEAVDSLQQRFFGTQEREGMANEVLNQGRTNIFDFPNSIERFASGEIAFNRNPPAARDGEGTPSDKLASSVTASGDAMQFIGLALLGLGIGFVARRFIK